MSETARIVHLLQQIFEGNPYYGPSVIGALEGVTAKVAGQRPRWSEHSIWDLVVHLRAELDYACAVIAGMAGSWIEGETTWPAVPDRSEVAWEQAIQELKRANRAFVSAVEQLPDDILDKEPVRVRGPYYGMLHGTLQHNVFHAGQISLLAGQLALGD